jgi:hypothetical protein
MNTEEISKLQTYLKKLGVHRDQLDEEVLVNHVIQDLPEFTLSIKMNFNNAFIDVQFYFRKTGAGVYYIHKYRATEPAKNRSHFFYMADALITMREAFNLLQGRAVEKQLNSTVGGGYITWIKFNFDESDSQGGYKYLKYPLHAVYNLYKVLNMYPIKEAASAEDQRDIVRKLKRGDIIPVTFELPSADVRKCIEANPHYRTINIYSAPKTKGKGGDRPLGFGLEIMSKDCEETNMEESEEDQEGHSEGEANIAV